MSRLVVSAFTLLAAAACAHAIPLPAIQTGGKTTRESLTIWSTVLGQEFTCGIAPEMLPDEPAWHGPGSGPPPISLDDAVAISRRDIPRYFDDSENWRLRTVELRSMCCPDKWYYIADWLPDGVTGDPLGIPVLMSGQTIELTRGAK